MANYKPHSFQLQRVDYSLRQKCERGQDAVWKPSAGADSLGFKGVLGPVDRSAAVGGFGEDAEAVAMFTTARSYFLASQAFKPHGLLTVGSETYRVLNPVTVGQVSIKFSLGDAKA